MRNYLPIVALSALILAPLAVSGQRFYIVQDPTDEYVYVRGDGNRVIDSLAVGTIVGEASWPFLLPEGWEECEDWEEWNSDELYGHGYFTYSYVRGDSVYVGKIHGTRRRDITTSPRLENREGQYDHLIELIPRSACDDLYDFKGFDRTVFARIPDIRNIAGTYYIMMDSHNGFNSGCVLWVVRNGKYEGRYLQISDAPPLEYLGLLRAWRGVPWKGYFKEVLKPVED